MVTLNKPKSIQDAIDALCDGGMVFSLCALIFVLPAAIAYLDSFAGLTVFFIF